MLTDPPLSQVIGSLLESRRNVYAVRKSTVKVPLASLEARNVKVPRYL